MTDIASLIAQLDTVQQAAAAGLWLSDGELDTLLGLPAGTASAARDRLVWRNFVARRQVFAGSGPYWALTNQAAAPVPADAPYRPAMAFAPEYLPEVEAVWRVVPDVLPDPLADQLVEYAIAHEPAFRPAGNTGNVDDYRTSLVLPVFNEFQRLLHNALLPHVAGSIVAFGMPRLSPLRLESYLNAYPDGTFFRLHVDNEAEPVRTRLLSFVYYFHRRPQAFQGGELVFHHARRTAGVYGTEPAGMLVPAHNSVAIFPSWVPHEVLPVQVPRGVFADSRFALTGWVHAVETQAPVV